MGLSSQFGAIWKHHGAHITYTHCQLYGNDTAGRRKQRSFHNNEYFYRKEWHSKYSKYLTTYLIIQINIEIQNYHHLLVSFYLLCSQTSPSETAIPKSGHTRATLMSCACWELAFRAPELSCLAREPCWDERQQGGPTEGRQGPSPRRWHSSKDLKEMGTWTMQITWGIFQSRQPRV